MIPFVVSLEEAKAFALEWLKQLQMASSGIYRPLVFGDLIDVPAANLLQWSECHRNRFSLVRATAAPTMAVVGDSSVSFTVTPVGGGKYTYASIQVNSDDSRRWCWRTASSRTTVHYDRLG